MVMVMVMVMVMGLFWLWFILFDENKINDFMIIELLYTYFLYHYNDNFCFY